MEFPADLIFGKKACAHRKNIFNKYGKRHNRANKTHQIEKTNKSAISLHMDQMNPIKQ